MADIEIVHRRGFVWLWWVAGILLLAVIVWLAVAFFEGRAADLEIDMDAEKSGVQAASAAPAGLLRV